MASDDKYGDQSYKKALSQNSLTNKGKEDWMNIEKILTSTPTSAERGSAVKDVRPKVTLQEIVSMCNSQIEDESEKFSETLKIKNAKYGIITYERSVGDRLDSLVCLSTYSKGMYAEHYAGISVINDKESAESAVKGWVDEIVGYDPKSTKGSAIMGYLFQNASDKIWASVAIGIVTGFLTAIVTEEIPGALLIAGGVAAGAYVLFTTSSTLKNLPDADKEYQIDKRDLAKLREFGQFYESDDVRELITKMATPSG